MQLQEHKIEKGAKSPKMDEGDLIQRVMGGFGRYQLGLYVLISLTKAFVAFHQLGIIFLAPKASYTCGLNETETCPCQDPLYDTTLFSNTIITEWDLICNRRWLTSFSQMLFQFGVLIGSVIFGMLADRFGRKPPLLAAVVIQLVAGIGAAYSPEYWTFTFLRFLVGLSVGGVMVTAFIILMEFVGVQYRETMAALHQALFNVGHMAISLYGYFFRDFSDFQLAISISGSLMLLYFVLVLETPRWLIAVKKTDEAIRVLERVAKINKRSTENIKSKIEAYQAAIDKNRLKKGNILDLFRTPNLRKHIIAMSINWLACGYCFYGVSQYVGQLSGNVFINVASSASVNLVGTVLAIPLIKVTGRRMVVIVFHFLSAACLLVLTVIPEGVGSVILATIGAVSSSVVFLLLYLYCAELFPTVVRNAALGFSSMIARVGSMIAPFVIDLQGVAYWMPPVAFATIPLIAGVITFFFLPETKGCELMTTIEEGEQFGKKSKTKT